MALLENLPLFSLTIIFFFFLIIIVIAIILYLIYHSKANTDKKYHKIGKELGLEIIPGPFQPSKMIGKYKGRKLTIFPSYHHKKKSQVTLQTGFLRVGGPFIWTLTPPGKLSYILTQIELKKQYNIPETTIQPKPFSSEMENFDSLFSVEPADTTLRKELFDSEIEHLIVQMKKRKIQFSITPSKITFTTTNRDFDISLLRKALKIMTKMADRIEKNC